MSRLNSKSEINHLSSLLIDINKNKLSMEMAKECLNRLKNASINKKIELYREKLKSTNPESNEFNDIIILISKLEKEKNEKL